MIKRWTDPFGIVHLVHRWMRTEDRITLCWKSLEQGAVFSNNGCVTCFECTSYQDAYEAYRDKHVNPHGEVSVDG